MAKQHGGLMGVSVDARKALGPDYYSNIPVSPKAMENLEAQRKKADAIADASVAKQREQIANIAQGFRRAVELIHAGKTRAPTLYFNRSLTGLPT